MLTGVRKPLQLGDRTIRLDQPQVMGILNTTPDSFSDGGRFAEAGSAVEAGVQMASDGAAILDWPVERIMTAPAITVETDKEIMGALSLMTQRRIRHLPVVEDGRIVGLVSIGDLVKYRMDQIEQEAEAMLSYIQSV